MTQELQKTALHDLHLEAGAKMVPFTDYTMPLHYAKGIMQEHLHTRQQASLFDVSHMGQIQLIGGEPGAVIEKLAPLAIGSLKAGCQRYTVLLNENGGIVDDAIVTRPFGEGSGRLMIVINASRKQADCDYIESQLEGGCRLERLPEKSLLAVQGPAASAVLTRLFGDEVAVQPFMSQRFYQFSGEQISISRCGYTGEDGYEISVSSDKAASLAQQILSENEVELVGLGARDSLRMECALCLYGDDIDETTTPVEADMKWVVAKARREKADFPGANRILEQLNEGAPRKRVGVRPDGRVIARNGAEITAGTDTVIGRVTSGCFSPTIQAPIAMGYVESQYADEGAPVEINVRGKRHPARITALPFVPTRYYRGDKT